MAYLGNNLQVAFPSYRNIDDISGSFNGVTTSFPLRVSGAAPVPLPVASNQCLISVAGVVQRPDDSGSEGFRLTGGNIVFSSAPAGGADFFGVILAGADYVHAGGQFPAGLATSPSIAFSSDPDTGLFNPAANEIAITTGGSEKLRIDSAGQLEATSLGTAAAPTYTFNTDPNTGIYSPGADQLAISTNGTGRLFVDSSGRVGLGTSSPQQLLHLSNTSQLRFPVSSTTNAISFWKDGTPSFAAEVGCGSATGIASALKFDIYNGSSWNTAVNIDSSSRVGIGTTSPVSLLQVGTGNTSANTAKAVFNTGDTTAAALEVSNWTGSATTNGPRIFFDNSARGRFSIGGGNGVHSFVIRDNEAASDRLTVDSSGRLLVGTSSARTTSTVNWLSQIEGGSLTGLGITSNSNDNSGAYLSLAKSRGASVGSNTIVQNGDGLGYILFSGADGTDANTQAAYIGCEVDGTPGANDMPGRLVFSTTADGASSPTERMRIDSSGNTRFFNASGVGPGADNTITSGFNGLRWSAVWAANGTIQTSDQRAKTEITDANLGSNFIKSLRPVSYKWIEGGKRDTGERDEDNNYIYESVPGERTHWGFIAQEVKQAVDAAGVDFGGWVLTDKDNPDSQQALRYDQFIAPLTKALQEALAEIDVLKAKVAALEGV